MSHVWIDEYVTNSYVWHIPVCHTSKMRYGSHTHAAWIEMSEILIVFKHSYGSHIKVWHGPHTYVAFQTYECVTHFCVWCIKVWHGSHIHHVSRINELRAVSTWRLAHSRIQQGSFADIQSLNPKLCISARSLCGYTGFIVRTCRALCADI